MNSRINASTVKRALFIDFNLYADNDPAFKQELIGLMVDNLQELQQALHISVEQKDPEFFLKACHKATTTLIMLEDKELNALVEDLKIKEADEARISLLNKLSAEIISSLLSEGI
jgi:hypothetical protein